MSTRLAYAGIDVSKRKFDLALRIDGRITTQRSFPNTAAGVAQLIDLLPAEPASWRIVLEATDRFHERLSDALAAQPGCEVMLVNPRRAHYYMAAVCHRAKTDRIDARGLALLAEEIKERFILYVTPSPLARELQLLGRHLYQLANQRAKCRNRLSSLDRQQPIHARAIASQQTMVAMLLQQANNLVDMMVELMRTDEIAGRCFDRLIQVDGLAETIASQLLSELVILPWDMTSRQWTAAAGLDPRARKSGQADPPRRISRMGNKYLRRALYIAALSLTRHHDQVRTYYLYLQEQGKPKKLALTIISRKLLHAIWVMLHRNQPFLAEKSFSVPAS